MTERSFLHPLMTAALAAFLLVGQAQAATPLVQSADDPVDFTAQTLSHDEKNQTVTAEGDVEMVQGDQILRADKIIYHLDTQSVIASGNVYLLDEKGDVHFAEYAELKDDMKDGAISNLLTLTSDGSRFTAKQGKRENFGVKTTLNDASYTVCHVCEADPHPLWQIKASRVVHDANEQTVKYKNARLEFLGIPMLYSPIFSHPDPTLKRKSGFLRPEYGWSTVLGTHIKAGYYYDIAPDKDMTVWAEPTTLAGTLVQAQWRQRFSNGVMQLDGSTATSDRKEEDGRVEHNRTRGHIFGNGLFDLDDQWRGGFDIAHASDKQYLRLYDISTDNVLTTQLFAERFSGRDYSRVSAYNFQDVRLGTRPDQPDILPMAEHNMLGEPGAMWGGRWEANFSALGLNRQNNNQSVQRGTMELGWERTDISTVGLSTVYRIDGSGDLYAVEKSDAAKLDPTLDSNPRTARGVATASVTTSYPLVRRFATAQAMIEPVAGVSLSPDSDNSKDQEIPNEDSIDINFDANNLFAEDRFPGLDRIEDGGRANYGLRTGFYGDNGRSARLFVGQSYRFSGDRIFPDGSGLEDRASDYVGQLQVTASPHFDADYRFMLDHKSLASKRHEVHMGGTTDRFRVDTRYFYTSAIDGTGLDEARQQAQLDGTYYIDKKWSLNANGLVDLGNEPGLRNAQGGVMYADECFTLALEAGRNVAKAATGEDETKIMLRIGFKNIGEFSGPQFSLHNNSQSKI